MTRIKARFRRSICVRCDGCDSLHMAYWTGDYAGADGDLAPVAVFTKMCPVTGMTMDYTEDEAVTIP